MKEYTITVANEVALTVEDNCDCLYPGVIIFNPYTESDVGLIPQAIPALILVLQKIHNDYSNVEVNVSAKDA